MRVMRAVVGDPLWAFGLLLLAAVVVVVVALANPPATEVFVDEGHAELRSEPSDEPAP